jgi:hypothetical protein
MKNESLGEVTGLPTREHWKVSILFPLGLFIGTAMRWRVCDRICRVSSSFDGVLQSPHNKLG